MTKAQTRINNNTAHEIALPPISETRSVLDAAGHPVLDGNGKPVVETLYEAAEGFRIPPGGKNVPTEYLDRLMGSDRPGHKRVRALYFDVRDGEASADLEIATDPEATTLREGPLPPKNLAGFKVEVALAVISDEDDKAALKRWKDDKRKEVAAAAKDRLARLAAAVPA